MMKAAATRTWYAAFLKAVTNASLSLALSLSSVRLSLSLRAPRSCVCACVVAHSLVHVVGRTARPVRLLAGVVGPTGLLGLCGSVRVRSL